MKHEARSTKHETISKNLKFRILNLFRISNFEFRIFCRQQKGEAALIAVILMLVVMLSAVFGASAVALKEAKVAEGNKKSRLSFFAAEAGVEDAVYRLKRGKNISSSFVLSLNGSTANTSILSSSGRRDIYSEGDASSNIRSLSATLFTTVGASFNYGAQVGYLGIHLENSPAQVNGSVYSNGPVSAKNGGNITGDAWAASRPSLDQQQPNQTTIIAYRDSAIHRDFAQSFKPSITAYIKEVKVWMRKVGTPSGGATVRIREDDGTGKPQTTGGINFGGSGSFGASDVTTSFQPITISLSSNNPLIEGDAYWLILEGGSMNATNYYEIAADADSSYSIGTSQWSSDWDASSPSWIPTGLDTQFEIHLKTDANDISGINSAGIVIKGNARAYAIGQNANICGDAFYQTTIYAGALDFLNNPTTQYCSTPLTPGTAHSNATAPAPVDMPLNLTQIQQLVDRADGGGTYSGDLILDNNETATLGPTKITGGVSLDSGSVLTMTGDLHIVGNFNCNQGEVRMDAGYSDSSGVIIVDGTTSIDNSCDLKGSGHQDSYIMLLSRYPERDSSPAAVHLKNLGNAIDKAIIYAPFGGVSLENSLTIHQVTGAKVNLKNQASVTYETGLANVKFSSGPSGGWDITNWEEIIP